MRYPVNNWNKWYLAGHFGDNRGTYFHNGVDINLLTGGNSDLGQPILAIADGKLSYYHNASHPTKSYGRHNVYKITGLWGTRWVHNAHTQKMLTGVQEVKEGQELARVGKSGTTYAHLHLAIWKVDPSSLRNGIDTIARTKTELNNWWEDPIAFIEKWKDVPTEPSDCETKLKIEEDHHEDTRARERNAIKEIDKLKEKVELKDLEISDIKVKQVMFLEKLSSILWGAGEPTLSDEDSIITKCREMVKNKEKVNELEDKIERQEDAHAQAIDEYKSKLNHLMSQMDAMEEKHASQIKNMKQQVKDELEGLSKEKEKRDLVNDIVQWFNKVFKKG